MEDPNSKIKMETKDKIQIAALIIISVLIIVLITAIFALVKNVDEIKSNPVQYAIDKEYYESCSCSNTLDDGRMQQHTFGNKLVIQNWTG